jgi:hypothetical protein
MLDDILNIWKVIKAMFQTTNQNKSTKMLDSTSIKPNFAKRLLASFFILQCFLSDGISTSTSYHERGKHKQH